MKQEDLTEAVYELEVAARSAEGTNPDNPLYDVLLIKCREFVKTLYTIRRPKKTFVNFDQFKIAGRGTIINVNRHDHADIVDVKVGEVVRAGLDDWEVLGIEQSVKGEMRLPGDNYGLIVKKKERTT